MITEGVLLGLALSGVLLVIGAKKSSRPVIFVSSVGWMICGLQIFQQTDEPLPMALLMFLSISQFMLFATGGRD